MISEKLEKLLIRIESLLLHLIKKRNIVCFETCVYNFCSLSAITYNNIRKRKEMYKEGLNWRFFLFFFFIMRRACGQQKEDRETRLDRRWKERPLENAKNLRPVRNAARIHGKSNSH